MNILRNFSLKKYNTFGIDAKAARFVSVASIDDLRQLIGSSIYKSGKSLVLGCGSNILFRGDFNGLIISMDIKGMKMVEITDRHVILEVGAGEIWHDFVEACVKNKYYGLENLALIPGKVGAAPVQNIGAYGAEQDEFVYSVIGIDTASNEERELSKEECKFGYRESIFKNTLSGDFIITSVKYKLNKQETLNLSYKELEQEISKFVVVEPSAEALFNAVCRLRKRILCDPLNLGNAGSFFKNPEINEDTFESLKESFSDIPGYESGDRIKIPAAWLIEQTGWKGKRYGNAGVSARHALVLVNFGNATGQEIYDLSEQIIASVDDLFGIQLDREVNVVE